MEKNKLVEETISHFNFLSNYDVSKGGQLLEENTSIINEDKFSRKLGEILKGNIPRIRTFAILTGQNPRSKQATKEYNSNKKEELESELKHGRFGFRKVDGMFDNPEISYFIPNMTKTIALDLGKKYDQTSIVFGEVKIDKEGKTYADTSEIYTYGKAFGNVKHKSKVFIELPNATNYYSKAYGKKFTLPFTRYTDNLKHAKWDDKNKSTILNVDNDLYDKYGNKIDSERLSETVIKQIEGLSKRSLNESNTGKYRWECRAEIDSILTKYK